MKNLLKVFSVLMLITLSASQAFAQVKDGDETVTEGSTITIALGEPYQRTLRMATGINYTWSTSNSAISIQSKTNKTCTIKGITPGKARLNYYCSYYIDGYYRTMNFYWDITIKSNTISVTNVTMSPKSATLNIGETVQLSATAYPTNATNRSLNWTTENYSIASVSSNGLVTARGAGRVWIWARATDGSGAGSYCVVDVNEPTKVTAVELSETEKTMTVGETVTLTATVLPEDAFNKELKWTSDNEEVATVTSGVIKAVKPGECNIQCETTDGSNISARCHIVVNEPEQHWLTVMMPNGNFSINVTSLDSVQLNITPDEGYNIHSITLDGIEQDHDNGKLTLQKFYRNSTLQVVFSDETLAKVNTAAAGSEAIKVTAHHHTITVKGMTEGQQVYVQDTQGRMVKVTMQDRFELNDAGIYILRIGNNTYKLAIQ